MEKNQLIKILEDWNFWTKDIRAGIKRPSYLKRLKALADSRQILLITGPRRAGKSFIMRQFAQELILGGVDRREILIVNFEDPRLIKRDTVLLQEIFDAYLENFAPKKKPYIFLDEIQEVSQWEKWVYTMRELDKAHLIISGSNAKLLGKELATLLTGRHLDMEVFPLDFREFLDFNDLEVKEVFDFNQAEDKIKFLFRNYLEFGGFPEVTLSDKKKEILISYFDDILEKDLIKRYKIRKLEKTREMLRFYLSNASCSVSFSALGRNFGLSTATVEKFSSYFQTAYSLFFLKRFSFKVKEQDRSQRKIYAVDTGLANMVGFRFSENVGKLAENIVFLHLKKQQAFNPSLEIYYWKDEQHKEVDFVVKEKNQVKQLIQVCWDIADFATAKRETSALLLASQKLKCDDLLILTNETEKEEKVKGKNIKFIPLWKWLLLKS